jgi:hypothetical protein
MKSIRTAITVLILTVAVFASEFCIYESSYESGDSREDAASNALAEARGNVANQCSGHLSGMQSEVSCNHIGNYWMCTARVQATCESR